MRRGWLIALFALGLLVTLIARLPLGLVLAPLAGGPVGWSAAEGTPWQGRLYQVFMGGLALGEIDLALAPAALLTGSARLDAIATGGAIIGRGRVMAGLGGQIGIADLSAEGRLAALPLLLALDGRVTVDIEQLSFAGGRCVTATGRIDTDALAVSGAALGWQGPMLSGNLRCDDEGRLILPLTGASDAATVASQLALALDSGDWRLDVTIDSGAPALAGLLVPLGFVAEGTRHTLVQTGRADGG